MATRLSSDTFSIFVCSAAVRRGPRSRRSSATSAGCAARSAGKHPTQVRHLALLSAYDQTLVQACDIVGVDAPLDGATEAERPFARLLTEAQLEEAGIALDPPGAAAA